MDMYETRQNMEKVSRRIEGGGVSRVRQRKHTDVMQRAHDLICKTKIDYIHKGEINSVNGEGENDKTDAKSVLQIIGAHPQTHWISLKPKVTNEPGKCAEPHSLANALSHMQIIDRITNIEQEPATFINEHWTENPNFILDHLSKNTQNRIFQEVAKWGYRIKESSGMSKDDYWVSHYSQLKRKIEDENFCTEVNNMRYRCFAAKYKKGDTYPPCETCKQWVSNLSNCVKVHHPIELAIRRSRSLSIIDKHT